MLRSTSNEFEYEESDLSNNEDTAQVLVSVSTGKEKVTLIMGIAIIWIVVVIYTNASLTLKTAEITEETEEKNNKQTITRQTVFTVCLVIVKYNYSIVVITNVFRRYTHI